MIFTYSALLVHYIQCDGCKSITIIYYWACYYVATIYQLYRVVYLVCKFFVTLPLTFYMKSLEQFLYIEQAYLIYIIYLEQA